MADSVLREALKEAAREGAKKIGGWLGTLLIAVLTIAAIWTWKRFGPMTTVLVCAALVFCVLWITTLALLLAGKTSAMRESESGRLVWVRTDVEPLDSSLTFTPKVRMELRLEGTHCAEVRSARCVPLGESGLSVRQGLPRQTWQVFRGGVWEPAPTGAERIFVLRGEHCRTWVAFETASKDELQRRASNHTLADLTAIVNGAETTIPL